MTKTSPPEARAKRFSSMRSEKPAGLPRSRRIPPTDWRFTFGTRGSVRFYEPSCRPDQKVPGAMVVAGPTSCSPPIFASSA